MNSSVVHHTLPRHIINKIRSVGVNSSGDEIAGVCCGELSMMNILSFMHSTSSLFIVRPNGVAWELFSTMLSLFIGEVPILSNGMM